MSKGKVPGVSWDREEESMRYFSRNKADVLDKIKALGKIFTVVNEKEAIKELNAIKLIPGGKPKPTGKAAPTKPVKKK